jgi:hypothetical protein
MYVSSRGLLKSCDVRYDEPNSSTTNIPDLNKLFNNCSLYICNSAIENFSKKIDDINCKFILVSGDADQENYAQMFSNYNDFSRFISNEKIIHWFSQNCTVSHPKITNLPIGLDYHSNHHSNVQTNEKESKLIEIKNKAKSFDNRINKCYVNFSYPPDFYHYKYDRVEAFNKIPKELYFQEKENQNVLECWEEQIKYAFVISPFGNGLDCHRTWEALILGCIPIVRSSGMNPLFENLPVLIIDDWGNISQELLDNTIEKYKNKTFEYDKLTLQYWKNKINSLQLSQTDNFENYYKYNNDSWYSTIFFIFFIMFLFLLTFFIFDKKYSLINFLFKKEKRKNR